MFVYKRQAFRTIHVCRWSIHYLLINQPADSYTFILSCLLFVREVEAVNKTHNASERG